MSKSVHLFLLVVGLIISLPLTAQDEAKSSPYYLSLKREILYGGAGALGTAAGLYLNKNVQSITFGDLKSPDLLGLDKLKSFSDGSNRDFRFAPRSAKQLSDIMLYTSVGLPTLFLSHRQTRRDLGTIGVLYLETMLLNQALNDITKHTVLRPRPYIWSEGFAADQPLNSNDRASFFSGHTSTSAAATFFFARVFSDYFPDSRLKPYVWGVAATLSLIHISEPTRLRRISYAVFCLKKKKKK